MLLMVEKIRAFDMECLLVPCTKVLGCKRARCGAVADEGAGVFIQLLYLIFESTCRYFCTSFKTFKIVYLAFSPSVPTNTFCTYLEEKKKYTFLLANSSNRPRESR